MGERRRPWTDLWQAIIHVTKIPAFEDGGIGEEAEERSAGECGGIWVVERAPQKAWAQLHRKPRCRRGPEVHRRGASRVQGV